MSRLSLLKVLLLPGPSVVGGVVSSRGGISSPGGVGRESPPRSVSSRGVSVVGGSGTRKSSWLSQKSWGVSTPRGVKDENTQNGGP